MFKEPEIIQVPFGRIQPWGKNPRNIKTEELKKLAKSLQTKGQFQVLTCWENGKGYETGGGNMRWQAMKKILNYSDDKPIWISLNYPKTEAEKIELSLLDNMRFGEYDEQQLAELVYPYIAEISLEDFKIDIGESVSLQSIIEDFAPNLDGREDEVPEIDDSPVITKMGDLFTLGRHRLLCGDSTKAEDVARLMKEEKADMVFTDPPYGMDMGFENDEKKNIELKEWNDKWIRNLPEATAFLSFHSPRLFWTLLDSAKEKGWNFERYFTFYKPNDRAFPWHGWLAVSEAILLFTKGKHKYNPNPPPKSEYTFWHDTYEWTHKNLVFDESKEDRQGFHPTIKPLPVIMNLLWRLTLRNQMAIDPFGGSGTTLIACEKLNRICYGMEIEPKYCDVIITRYCNYTDTPEEEIRATKQ